MQKKHWISMLFSLLLITTMLTLAGCTETQTFELTEDGDEGSVILYYFWGKGCSHCAEAKPRLEEWDKKYPDLKIRAYEVWYNETNQGLYTQMADHYGISESGRGTPTFYLNDQHWVGYSADLGDEIEAAIEVCNDKGCGDAGSGIMPGASNIGPIDLSTVETGTSDIVNVPIIGKVDLSHQSLFISTILIAIVDGVNPCSVWVLTMLLALTLHTGSRKKVAIIGIVFLTVTAVVYALFITGLFTVFTFTSFTTWIQAAIAVLALFFAAVNIKDYFWYKEGISFTIADDKKPGIYQRIRKIMDASQSFGGLVGSTVLMALGVSVVEFSCTAGFPVLWTNLLVSQKVGALAFALLLLVYMIIYQGDELVIFFTAVYSLKASKLEEKQGRILKLVGGMLMLTLAVVLLVNPSWMNSLTKSLIIFAIAFGLTGLVLLVHRVILPKFGIWIGTEGKSQRKRHGSSKGKHK